MRIDKFLKNSRLIKRRTIAKEACEQERITINGKIAKPGSEVNIGDIINNGKSAAFDRVIKERGCCQYV